MFQITIWHGIECNDWIRGVTKSLKMKITGKYLLDNQAGNLRLLIQIHPLGLVLAFLFEVTEDKFQRKIRPNQLLLPRLRLPSPHHHKSELFNLCPDLRTAVDFDCYFSECLSHLNRPADGPDKALRRQHITGR